MSIPMMPALVKNTDDAGNTDIFTKSTNFSLPPLSSSPSAH